MTTGAAEAAQSSQSPQARRADTPATAGWRLRRRLALAFGLLGLLAAVLVAEVVVSTTTFVRAGNQVIYRWQPVGLNVSRLTVDLLDQETGVRGYLLGGDRSFLDPYRRALASQARHVSAVRDLAGDDRAVQARLDDLLTDVRTWQRTVARPAIAAAEADGDAGTTLTQSRAAKRAFDRIRTDAAALQREVVERAADARHDRRVAGVVFVVALSLAFLLVVLGAAALWLGLRRWVLGPVDELGRQTRRVASGELHRTIEPAGPVEITDLARDVEGMRRRIAADLARAEEVGAELRRQGAELERSNQDLEQFAYVASHDLSEPLRKVANFCQLLERQYADELDDRARQYIGFAVDGARRMQALISDLLSLSRVGRNAEAFVAVDLEAKLDQALRNLAERIDAAGATVVRETALPTVLGDHALLVSLLQNLVGNAVKYRRDDVAPVVRVGARLESGVWHLTVTDNGIGIDAQYAERIFAVFQRLHVREKYEGTGIGLALCRRIAEHHGGQIRLATVESADHGAAFEVTLPQLDTTPAGSGHDA